LLQACKFLHKLKRGNCEKRTLSLIVQSQSDVGGDQPHRLKPVLLNPHSGLFVQTKIDQ